MQKLCLCIHGFDVHLIEIGVKPYDVYINVDIAYIYLFISAAGHKQHTERKKKINLPGKILAKQSHNIDTNIFVKLNFADTIVHYLEYI